MRRAGWLLGVVFVSLSGPSGVDAVALRLTLDEALSRAKAVDLEGNRSEVEIAQANLSRSKDMLSANPFVSAGAQRTSQGGVPNYNFLVSQEFEVAGQRGKRIEAALLGVQKASSDLQTVGHNLTATVKSAFVQGMVASQRITVAQQAVDAATELVRQLDKPGRLSNAQRMDRNLTHIHETRARRDVAAAEQARDTAVNTLRRLLGLAFDQEIELIGAPLSLVKELPPGPELVRRALQQRTDLNALRYSTQRADKQLSLTQREAIPNVTVSGTVSRFEGDIIAGGDIGVALPIFRSKTPDIQEALAERDRAGVEAQSLERTIAQEVLDARRTCDAAAADLQASQRDIVPRSEENLELQRQLYERGEVTASELINVQIDLFNARREYLDAQQTYNEALIDLERVSGESFTMP